MKKWFRLVCMVVALCLMLGSGVASMAEQTGSGGSAALDKFLEAVDTNYAYEIALTLAEDTRFHNSSWGDRTAGSAAEHAAADWLVGKMNEIGLSDVVKEGAKCDLWQFNGASFQIQGENKQIVPHSYATAGTPEGGLNAEVVYLGKGTQADYEGVDVKGKIVLVDIDQRADWWITYPMLEAMHQGAAAIMSNEVGGFAQISKDAYNAQDICAPTAIPCVSISRNDAEYIKAQLDKGSVTANLRVDNVVGINEGTTYNVMGKIKGRSSDYQVLVGGHYDTHFQGFQDDSCAVGLALAMAKAMIDSGYQPENDIVFVLHGAEEWGSSNTQFDWTVGAWEMINTLHPEWQQKTLAFLNFELPAYEFDTYTTTYSAPEMFSMLRDFAQEAPKPENCFPEGVLTEGYPTYTYSDDFSYYAAGVPSMVNGFLLQKDMETVFPFYEEIYHSNFDTKETYNENVMRFNMKYYGAMAMYIDRLPALPLDFTAQYDRMDAAIDEAIMADAGVDVAAYRAVLEGMNEAAEALYAQALEVNARYAEASSEEAVAFWEEGRALTAKNLELFNFAQDAFLGLMYEKPIVPHEAPQINIQLIGQTIEALKEGDSITAADEYAWQINNVLEWYAMAFSPEVIAIQDQMFWGEENQDNLYWGTGKGFEKAQVENATRGLIEKYDVADADFAPEIAIYEQAVTAQQAALSKLATRELEDIKTFTEMLSK